MGFPLAEHEDPAWSQYPAGIHLFKTDGTALVKLSVLSSTYSDGAMVFRLSSTVRATNSVLLQVANIDASISAQQVRIYDLKFTWTS